MDAINAMRKMLTVAGNCSFEGDNSGGNLAYLFIVY